MKRISLLAIPSLAALIFIALSTQRSPLPLTSTDVLTEPACVGLAPIRTPGAWRRYQIDAHGESATSVLGESQRFEGRLRLSATLELLELEGHSLQAKLVEVDAFDLTLLGHEHSPEVQGATAYVTLDARGALQELRWPEGTRHEARVALEVALRGAQVILEPGATTWKAELRDALGQASYRWEVSGCGDGSLSLQARPSAYTLLDASQQGGANAAGEVFVALDASGAITTLRAQLHADAEMARASWKLEMKLLERGHERGALQAATRLHQEAKPHLRSPADEARQRLEARVAGLTWADAREDLLAYASGGNMPDHERWLWRATGLLELHPELSAKFAELLPDERLGRRGQALVLDLLANVGHPQAQHQLREVLTSREDAPEYTHHVQRLLLLPRAEDETATMLSDHMRELEHPDARHAAAVTLGAVTSRLEDPETARRMVQEIGLELGAAQDPTPWLTALGNAGTPEVLEHVRGHLRADDPGERRTAARALRKVDTPEAREALFGALGDAPDLDTRRELLRSLSRHHMSAQDLGALTQWIKTQAGDLDPRLLHGLLVVLQTQAGVHPDVVLDLARALEPLSPQGSVSAGFLALIAKLSVS